MDNEESEGLYSPATPKANGPGKPLPKKAENPSTIQTNFPPKDEPSRSSSGTSQPSSDVAAGSGKPPSSTATEESNPAPTTTGGTKTSANDATQVQGGAAGNAAATPAATSPSQAEGTVTVATPLSPRNMPLPQSPQASRTPSSSKSDSLTAELRGVFGRYMAPDNTEYEDAHNVVQIFLLSIMCLCLTYHIAARTVTTILDAFAWAVTRAAAGICAAAVAVAMVPVGGAVAFCGLARAVVCGVFGSASTTQRPTTTTSHPDTESETKTKKTEMETETETGTAVQEEPSALAALGLRFKALGARAGDHVLCVCLVAVLVFRLWEVENNYRNLDWERVERAERIDWEEIDRCRAAVGAW
ncbi:hypothetical protein SLS58_002842 [Diplodia intermedia]|uniref:Uncharacterized protein n=1 Tax=Diplodia intermedia TaxID=856260 RepID=A0ABR3TXU7_9PEZI